jgi:sec-independent protein translocase protein TatA
VPFLGFWDLLIVAFVVLLIFGPKRIPKLGRSLGAGARELGTAAKGLRDEVTAKHDGELERPQPAPSQPAPSQPAASRTPRDRDSIS